MTVLEFETLVEDGVIHIPQDIADQIAKGSPVRVSIEPVEKQTMTPDEAWESVLAFIDQRTKDIPPGEGKPYQWNRDDAYEHLKKYGHDDEGTD